ncbi:MAG: hypothetical protein V1724_02175 [Chloroflexota bacterium]
MAQENAGTQEAKSLEVIYALAARLIDEQLKEVEGADTKPGLVFGVSSVIVGLLLTSLPSSDLVSAQRLLILVLPLAVYLIIIVLAILSYRFLSLEYPPDIGRMYEEALFWEPEITKRQVLSKWVSAIEKNKIVIDSKVKRATIALYLLAVEAITAVIASVLIHLP